MSKAALHDENHACNKSTISVFRHVCIAFDEHGVRTRVDIKC